MWNIKFMLHILKSRCVHANTEGATEIHIFIGIREYEHFSFISKIFKIINLQGDLIKFLILKASSS